MTTNADNGFRRQLRRTAAEASSVPEAADVMARALFSLQFADRWLAEQVDLTSVAMRGAAEDTRKRFVATGRTVDITIESNAEERLTASVEPPAPGWALIRVGDHRELARIDEDGMFSVVLPPIEGAVDLALEFDDGVTITVTDVAG